MIFKKKSLLPLPTCQTTQYILIRTSKNSMGHGSIWSLATCEKLEKDKSKNQSIQDKLSKNQSNEFKTVLIDLSCMTNQVFYSTGFPGLAENTNNLNQLEAIIDSIADKIIHLLDPILSQPNLKVMFIGDGLVDASTKPAVIKRRATELKLRNKKVRRALNCIN
jgi:hypothetical protein